MNKSFTLQLDSSVTKVNLHSLSLIYFLQYLKVSYKDHHTYIIQKYLLKMRIFSYIIIIYNITIIPKEFNIDTILSNI